jgi:hypothetical protein
VFPEPVSNKQRLKDFRAAGISSVDGEGKTADLHSLRVTLATRLAQAGVQPQVAKTIMRHSDYRTTLRSYTALTLKDATAAIGALSVSQPEDAAPAPPAESPAVPAPSGAKPCETTRRSGARGRHKNRSGGPKTQESTLFSVDSVNDPTGIRTPVFRMRT